jgi:hypothetical protein
VCSKLRILIVLTWPHTNFGSSTLCIHRQHSFLSLENILDVLRLRGRLFNSQSLSPQDQTRSNTFLFNEQQNVIIRQAKRQGCSNARQSYDQGTAAPTCPSIRHVCTKRQQLRHRSTVLTTSVTSHSQAGWPMVTRQKNQTLSETFPLLTGIIHS